MAALLCAAILGFNGYADYASVGVGYNDAYYVRKHETVLCQVFL